MNEELTPLDAYLNKVYETVIIITPVAALMASLSFTLFKIFNWYKGVSWLSIIIFGIFDIIFYIFAKWHISTVKNEDGILIKGKVERNKKILCIGIIIQWNLIAYIFPINEWWVFSFFFIMLTVFFFDIKLTLFTSLCIDISIIISWFLNNNLSLIFNGNYFIPDLILRLIVIGLTTFCINLIVYLGKVYLVEELERYFNYDTLTHLLNRRSLDSYLEESYNNAKSGKSTFCLLLLDIDNFKRINDTYGHDCGDEVLKMVSNLIKTSVSNNAVFRWGGEEILILINSDKTMAVNIAEDIRNNIFRKELNYNNEIIKVTVTIGITSYAKNRTLKQMFKDADEKLYYGKNHGKNQVVSMIN